MVHIPRGIKSGQNLVKLFALKMFFHTSEFSETLQKHEQSGYTNDFDIRDPGKIRVFEPQGGKGAK